MFSYFRLFPPKQLASHISQSLALSHSNDVRTKYLLSPIRVLAPCRARLSTRFEITLVFISFPKTVTTDWAFNPRRVDASGATFAAAERGRTIAVAACEGR